MISGSTPSRARWKPILLLSEFRACETANDSLNASPCWSTIPEMPADFVTEANAPESAMIPQHECGIFAVFGHPNAAVLTYYGLFALQHRGQESAGIVTSNGNGSSFQLHRDMGLVSQVFGAEALERLKGRRAVGHARYSTTGSSTLKNAQPFVVDCFRGALDESPAIQGVTAGGRGRGCRQMFHIQIAH